ncbi:MAG: endo-1,4-beta-xylanase [Bacteroidales bacterium]|nr:endo-1,4-beta-xylanase [Bacteroidales bacterium]
MIKPILFSALCLSVAGNVCAQLSSNPDKFLGNITTRGQVNGTGYEYSSLWNQITPENESKWQSVEWTRDVYTWDGCDNAYNYAKKNNFPFKFHTLVWGSQYPNWMDGLSKEEQFEEIVEWMDAVKERYPDLQMIDVVNEAIVGHAPAPYKEALGGDGKTGYDWIIKAFEMAAERWPDAILIYNDYNTFQWQKSEFIDLVKTIRDAGAPIDAYGCQSHDLTDIDFNTFKASMEEIQDALQMPMYSTEYDIGTESDTKQETQYKNQIKYMWEQEYVAGVTLWGFIYGATWTTDGNSGIIKDGKERPAMTWLKEYMATEEAKTAKSPFPGMKKEASVYVKPQALNLTIGEESSVAVNARLASKTIEKIELYINDELSATLKEAPYTAKFTPEKLGETSIKAVVYATDGSSYTRMSGVNVNPPRRPFKDEMAVLPGIIEAEDFDEGGDGVAFHDSNKIKEGTGASYREDGGVDIEKGNGGYVLGYTLSGEWTEYTVDVKEAGYYDFEAYVSSSSDNSTFSIDLSDADGLTSIAKDIVVPNKGWNTYSNIHGRSAIKLEEGVQRLRITIGSGSSYVCNIDKIAMTRVDLNEDIKIDVDIDVETATVGTAFFIKAKASCEAVDIKSVTIYINGVAQEALTAAPFEMKYTPSVDGVLDITAVATDADGKVSVVAEKNVVVNKKREPFKSVITVPGTIEVENFDKGGEGLTFHDSDSNDEGNAGFRNDNEGVDIVKCTGGYALGYTATGEWLEYTINVTVAAEYNYETVVASGADNSGFKISLVKDGELTDLTDKITVPNGGTWDVYTTLKGTLKKKLEVGQQTIRVTIMSPYVNIDNIKLISNVNDGIEEIVCDTEAVYEAYTLTGVLVGKVEASGLADLQQKMHKMVGKRGLYVIKNVVNGNSMKMMIK